MPKSGYAGRSALVQGEDQHHDGERQPPGGWWFPWGADLQCIPPPIHIQISCVAGAGSTHRPGEMTTIPGSPVWELVKKNNYFLIKQFGNSNTKVQFSKEPNNLYNVHSYKFSGLANSKTVAVQPSAGEDKAVVLSTTKTKKQNTPAKLQHKTLMRKEFRKMTKSVKNQVLTPEFCT
ncbi:60S ribosomal protein L28-1-like isoform X2 [Triticum urartu]|uniref:Ribosomal eL28/Mak16 domain-containing protein n=1 Tax=Triticum urartu TaxID=4572 RepID=A0A8R7V2R3_TRIUA|nr:60S ribosomal protein L28-1-like isoform X2 [Triticum urartu]